MSAQFGRWNFDGKPVDREYLDKARASIAPYGPDDSGSYSKGYISILFRAFHTSKESRRETQPYVTASGAILTWDGRLDNRTELIRRLRDVLTVGSTDISIVAAAYQEWGTDCFANLIGDWALSIWDANTRSLILAKDPIGTRHLYYSVDKDQVTWSTILDPIVLFGGKTFALCEEYIAGWFSFFPATHLTPYVGIYSVPPSSSVLIRAGKQAVSKYWDFDPSRRIRYRTDAEYEEHFRAVFADAVRRRLRSDNPILAELSGGMDSSSIVCIADTIIARGSVETPRVDTVSYYNDSEPNWNERPYFAKVEEKRNRTGCHIDVGKLEPFNFELDSHRFAATPDSSNGPDEASRRTAAYMASHGNRVVLTGLGGDEVTGGVPTPLPQLEDLLARGRFRALAGQLKVWALSKRKPWFHLLFETLREFLPVALIGLPKRRRPVPWLNPDFVQRNRAALRGYKSRLNLFGPEPSFQDNVTTFNGLRRQIACTALSSEPLSEKRYPYLDQDLVGFLFAIPREQLVRPGQRRSLMRRALIGIVPDEILNRKRKAYVVRCPLTALAKEWPNLKDSFQQFISTRLGYICPVSLSKATEDAVHGCDEHLLHLLRTLTLELWLKSVCERGRFDELLRNAGETEYSHCLQSHRNSDSVA